MKKEELRVIVNPTAADGAVGTDWPQMRSFLQQQGVVFKDVLTEAPGHATELAKEAVYQGYRTVVAVGGDGTVNEVVNGLVNGTDPSRGQMIPVSLGVVSRGTGCDLMRTLRKRDPKEAMRALAQRDMYRVIDLGEIIMDGENGPQQRLFVNVAGLGFDGEVVEGLIANENAGKNIGGTVPYLLQIFRSISKYDNKYVRARIDELEMEDFFTAFFACNGRYFAGGMKVAPDAEIDDGLFDVVVLHQMSRLGLLARLPTVYVGMHTHFRVMEVVRGKELRVDTEDRVLIQADGELVGLAPATIRILPGALRIRI